MLLNLKIPFVLLLIVATLLPLTAQNDEFEWWNELHDWDGVTHWSRYLITFPAFMGPNALPVPEVRKGIVSEAMRFEVGGEVHFSQGDDTQNAFGKLYIPLVKNLVAVEGYLVPIEHYKMTEATRDERRARDFSGEGRAAGDIYLGTIIQFLKEKNKRPAMALSINLKTASGRGFENARNTDSPGYYFDVSGSKGIDLKANFLKKIRIYAMAGFYVWQTNRAALFQDDAILYGGGFDLAGNQWTLSNEIGGYSGYFDKGDQPMVYRLHLSKQFGDWQLNVRYQKGLQDFEYHSLKLTVAYLLVKNFLD